jgi:L-lactate dehydrogenase complex protein LldG
MEERTAVSESPRNLDRNNVLDDVRRALGRTATVAPAPLDLFIEPIVPADAGELIVRFTEEATAVGAKVYLMSDQLRFVADGREQPATQPIDKLKVVGQVVDKIAEICAAYKGQEIALSSTELFAEMDLITELAARGFSTFVANETDHEKLVARLANCGVGLTAADYAIAETGTIVLSSDEANALLVSLLPPVHIAVLRSSQIAASLDEVISKLSRERISRVNPSRSVTLITGPSRTSDVELVLSIGVHGPKELHVIILD